MSAISSAPLESSSYESLTAVYQEVRGQISKKWEELRKMENEASSIRKRIQEVCAHKWEAIDDGGHGYRQCIKCDYQT